MTTFKKILLIDATLNKNDATGITLSNLFGSWPKEKLFMIGNKEMVSLSAMAGFKNTYVLEKKDFYHRFPLGLLLKFRELFKEKDSNKTLKETAIIENQVENLKVTSPIKKFSFKSILYYIFQYFGLHHLFFRQIISNELREWINKTDPDYFYAVLSTRHSILFAKKLVSEFRKPIIIHIMDDWPSTIGNETLFQRFWNRLINSELKKLLYLAHKRIAISELMATEFSKRFGNDWLYFHNPVDGSVWKVGKFCKTSFANNFRILYSGRLSIGVLNTIKLVAEAVDNLNETIGWNITFQIQSSTKPSWIQNYKNTVFSKQIPYNMLPSLYSSVDLLLLPYDFNGRTFDFIRLSMPAKITEYMASGTPTLIVAPEDCALSHLVIKTKSAHLVNTMNLTEIKANLVRLLENKELREFYSKNAIKLVNSNFDIRKVQNEFLKVFSFTDEC